MNKTKSNNKELRHYELEIRTVAQDTVDFINYVVKNQHYKFKRAKYVILQIFVGIILFAAAVTLSVLLSELGVPSGVRLIVIVCTSYLIVRTMMTLKCPFPKILKDDVAEAIIQTTSPYYGETERKMFYNLGEKGFSTDSYMPFETMLYEYGAFNKVIECELGIIMILDNCFIHCIPARYFNDDSACFIVEKFKKECGRKFITTGKMNIS